MLPAPAPVACTYLVTVTAAPFVVANTDEGHPLAQQLLRRLALKNYVVSSTCQSNFVPLGRFPLVAVGCYCDVGELVYWLELLTYIREIPGSNMGSNLPYSDRSSS
jgi:hypothetical protein